MASKSKELLAGNDIEEILKVIDSDILAEKNSLESQAKSFVTEFASTISKIRDIISESCFLYQNSRKTYNYIHINLHLHQINIYILLIH